MQPWSAHAPQVKFTCFLCLTVRAQSLPWHARGRTNTCRQVFQRGKYASIGAWRKSAHCVFVNTAIWISYPAVWPKMSSDVLNGWKEISDYIGRGVRTVQRWELQFELPIHRPS